MLECCYAADPTLSVERIRLLDDVFWVTNVETSYVVAPVREGLLIPADSGVAFTHRFDTYAYEGCHMKMLGVVKSGAEALVTWTDPYLAVGLKSTLTNAPSVNVRQILSGALALRKSAKSFRVRLLGPGDYNTIA